MITNNQLFQACKYIEQTDKNSFISDMYDEYLAGDIPQWTIVDYVIQIFKDWLEDMVSNGLNKREMAILDSLGIDYPMDYKTMFLELQKLNNELHDEYMLLLDENKKLKGGK